MPDHTCNEDKVEKAAAYDSNGKYVGDDETIKCSVCDRIMDMKVA